MNASIQFRALWAAALACWTVAIGSVHAASQPSSLPALSGDAAIKMSQAVVGTTVGDYTLMNTDGRPVRLSSYRGKPLLVNFIYTGCFQVCPTATRTLKRAFEAAQGALGVDAFHAVSIGFNVPFDTPEALRAFARQQAADRRGWDFLSPDAARVEALTRDFGFTYRPSPRGFDHVLQITIVDADGRIYRQVYGDDFAVPQIVGPLRELITGARRENESFAGLLDRIRILCTVYDPASGTYRIKYSIFFELAGGVLGLIATGWFLWRELRRARTA